MEITLKIEDAVKNAGDTEVIEGYFQQGKHQAAIGDFLAANATFDLILSKPKATTGKRIDSYMEQAKIALFCLDTKALKGILASAKVLNESGGDWDRRNRLKIYEAFYLLAIRDVAGASQLLLDCVATFTCTELASYKDFMFLLLVTALISLDRNQLRDKLIKDPHVITTSRELPIASKLVHSIYQCKYTAYFESILALSQELSRNRFLGPLAAYLIREYRVLAYRQFLEAYQSVMLSSMAAQFGISVQLLDQELSRFIASGRLNAKIDKVSKLLSVCCLSVCCCVWRRRAGRSVDAQIMAVPSHDLFASKSFIHLPPHVLWPSYCASVAVVLVWVYCRMPSRSPALIPSPRTLQGLN